VKKQRNEENKMEQNNQIEGLMNKEKRGSKERSKNGVTQNSRKKMNLSKLTAIYLREARFGDVRVLTPIPRHSFIRQAASLIPG
jgi:hypothetical protein